MEMDEGGSFRFLSHDSPPTTVRAIQAPPPPPPPSMAGWTSVFMDGIISVAGKEGGGNSSSSRSSSDAMIGLELGKRTYFELPAVGGGSCSGAVSTSAPVPVPVPAPAPAPLKRPRFPGLSPICQVEGCKADLSSAKEYHRRHKVCSAHSKAARVVVAGQDQRFCQQCSRFHGLGEFDQGKRSCRRRLAGHNERRRKPQPIANHLGLNAAAFLPPPFQQDSSRKLGLHHHLYAVSSDRPSFLSHPRVSSSPSVWDDYSKLQGWSQRILEHSTLGSMAMAAAVGGGNIEPNVSSQFPFDQTQKGGGNMIAGDLLVGSSAAADLGSAAAEVHGTTTTTTAKMHQYYVHGHHHYNQGSSSSSSSVQHNRSSSSSTSTSTSSSSSSALQGGGGLEAIPIIGQGLARVSVIDSGRALSLQSNLQQLPSSSSSPSSEVAMPHPHPHHHQILMSDHNNNNNNIHHFGSHIPIAQPLSHSAQLHHHHPHLEWMGDNLFSSSSAGFFISQGSSCSSMLDKDQVQRPFMAYSSMGNYGGGGGSKETIDLMQMTTAAVHNNQAANQALVLSSGGGGYEMGLGVYGELQSSIFRCEQ